MELKDTQTEKNLYRAFTGEALAHIKYQFYKSKITDEYKKYEPLLDEIIHNEKEHAKIWFKILNNGSIPSIEECLEDAINGETFEYKDMYPTFSKIAEEEGFDEIAELFKEISEIEGRHSQEYTEILKEINTGVFKSEDTETVWKCLNCGHIIKSMDSPSECPVCHHPRKYFKKEKINS